MSPIYVIQSDIKDRRNLGQIVFLLESWSEIKCKRIETVCGLMRGIEAIQKE